MTVEVRLHADYETHPTWLNDEAGLENVDPGELPIPSSLADEIRAWGARYSATYNPDDPLSSGFASPKEESEFDQDGRRLWGALQHALGPGYSVSYYSVETGWERGGPKGGQGPFAALRLGGLRDASSARRAATAHLMAEEYVGEAMDELRHLLKDDAPFAFRHAGKLMVGEVRFAALGALELMYQQIGKAPDFGTVEVRKSMTADEVQATLDCIDDSERVLAARKEAQEFVASRVVPDSDQEAKVLTNYRILQLLGAVEYRHEEVDPVTYMTPLQAEVSASQLASERPKPHAEFRSSIDQRVLGYYYKNDGRWLMDFAEDAEASALARTLRSILSVEKDGVPKVVRNPDGSPKTSADGSLVLDGVASFDGDPLEVLFSVAAFLGTEAGVDVVS